MDNIITTGIVSVVVSACSSLTTWIFARRRYNSEVDGNYIKNLEHAVDDYKKIIESYQEEIRRKDEKIDSMEQRMDRMQKRQDEMQEKLDSVQKQLFERNAELSGLASIACADSPTCKNHRSLTK